MVTDINPAFEHLELRVLEEYDPNYETFVARCLETGTTVTAPTMDELQRLMLENLRLEIKLAAKALKLDNLLRQQASSDVFVRWQQYAASARTESMDIDIEATPRRTVKSEIKITSNNNANRVA